MLDFVISRISATDLKGKQVCSDDEQTYCITQRRPILAQSLLQLVVWLVGWLVRSFVRSLIRWCLRSFSLFWSFICCLLGWLVAWLVGCMCAINSVISYVCIGYSYVWLKKVMFASWFFDSMVSWWVSYKTSDKRICCWHWNTLQVVIIVNVVLKLVVVVVVVPYIHTDVVWCSCWWWGGWRLCIG